MRSGLICPETEAPCTDGRCKKDHCVATVAERLQQRKAEAEKAARLEKAEWDRVQRFVQDAIKRDLKSN